jgi:hypothetical protein
VARGPLVRPDSLEGHHVIAYNEEAAGMPGNDWLERAVSQVMGAPG